MKTKYVTLTLTKAEAEGLRALAGEGAEGLLTDPAAASVYIGKPSQQNAARRGLLKLERLLLSAKGSGR